MINIPQKNEIVTSTETCPIELYNVLDIIFIKHCHSNNVYENTENVKLSLLKHFILQYILLKYCPVLVQ